MANVLWMDERRRVRGSYALVRCEGESEDQAILFLDAAYAIEDFFAAIEMGDVRREIKREALALREAGILLWEDAVFRTREYFFCKKEERREEALAGARKCPEHHRELARDMRLVLNGHTAISFSSMFSVN